MLLWQPGRGAVFAYSKQRVVPFGEYIPYRSFFRRLTPTVDQVGTDMAAGRGTALVKVPITRLGRSVPLTTVICFEVAYDDLVRSSVLAGSAASIARISRTCRRMTFLPESGGDCSMALPPSE